MGKSVPYVFLAVSLVFFLFLVGLTAYRIDSSRKAGAASAETAANALVEQADALRKAGGFDSGYFTQKMRDLFTTQPRLLALTIHSQADGILYLISRSKSYIAQPAEVTPEWRGTPEYRYSSGYEALLTRFFPSPDQAVSMDALFVVFGREDLFPILRDDLYLILGFLILCGIFILIASSVQEDRLPGAARRRPTAGPVLSPEQYEQAPEEPAGYEAPPPREEPIHRAPPASEPPMLFDVPPAPPRRPAPPDAEAVRHAPQGFGPQPAGREPAAYAPAPGQGWTGSGAGKEARAPAQGRAPAVMESKPLVSPESGLVWAEHLEPRLKAEITRAATSDQDLSMALMALDVPNNDPDISMLYNGVARIVKESYPIHDLIFENGRTSIAVVMPDRDIDQAVALCEEMRKKTAGSSFSGRTITVSMGASARGGRLIDGSTLRSEAEVSVQKASREGGNKVIGFRVDPTKYRESL